MLEIRFGRCDRHGRLFIGCSLSEGSGVVVATLCRCRSAPAHTRTMRDCRTAGTATAGL